MSAGYAEIAITSVLNSEKSFCKFLSANDTGAEHSAVSRQRNEDRVRRLRVISGSLQVLRRRCCLL